MQLLQNIWNDENLIKVLKEKGVVVMPTDTIYGIVGQALSSAVVLRIYNIKKRAPEKPFIILIGEIGELEKFSIILSEKQKDILKKYWPGPVSIILDCSDETLLYLHRGTKTLAFRVPAQENLRKLLLQTGPLVAPSANPEGLAPAQNIFEAKKYFSNAVDLYVDGGEIISQASKVIELHKDGTSKILRP
ncbi:threonylcarbamoyl-AMP synthase [Patescibacteria group bacterium]|nr:threonylcarbamoyl-AMP synthase [Patescibacteria group bacterium]